MKERVISVGDPIPLVGILSEPETLNKEKPMVLILNSGIMHHIGTCRISVKLARALAVAGYASVRFDFSGIGDSEQRRGSLSFLETAPIESAEIMDFIQKRRGVKKFIIYGLCSGADAAYETALVDKRVVGICQIDGYCYKTLSWYLFHYKERILKLNVWLNFVKRKLINRPNTHVSIDDIDSEYIEKASYIREFPIKSEYTNGLQKLVNNSVKLFFIFTDGQSHIINRSSQYKKSLKEVDFKDCLRVDYIPEAEHIITEPDCQKDVVKRIVHWVGSVDE